MQLSRVEFLLNAVPNQIAVIFAGHVCVDVSIPEQAVAQLKPNTLVRVDAIPITLGGPGGAAAVAASKLGFHPIFIGGVGAGPFGVVQNALLSANGVDVSRVVPVDAVSSATIAVPFPAGRNFVHALGQNARLTADHFPAGAFAGGLWFHLAGVGLLDRLHGAELATVMRRAKAQGIASSLDTVHPGSMIPGEAAPWIAAALPYTDVVFMSEAEMNEFTGKNDAVAAARELRDQGARTVVVKRGAHGALILHEDGALRNIPARQPLQLRNDTGAGDAFCAAAVCALAGGLDIAKAVEVAIAAGTVVVENGTGTAALPPWDDLVTIAINRPELVVA